MLDLFFTAFCLAFLAAGTRRPFLFVLAYTYIDIVAPQKVSWGFLTHIPISLIAFSLNVLCARSSLWHPYTFSLLHSP
jgi:hypothetical protein